MSTPQTEMLTTCNCPISLNASSSSKTFPSSTRKYLRIVIVSSFTTLYEQLSDPPARSSNSSPPDARSIAFHFLNKYPCTLIFAIVSHQTCHGSKFGR
uniref:Ovule protein n=1 Tax=Ascaris lumbricoides TaxID=6252 RepID=A0A0M3HGG0_ASCLU